MNGQQEKTPGFNCPNCDFFIEVSLKSLLFDSGQDCPGCLTGFKMDRQESKKALELMQKLNTVVDNLESAKDFSPANYSHGDLHKRFGRK